MKLSTTYEILLVVTIIVVTCITINRCNSGNPTEKERADMIISNHKRTDSLYQLDIKTLNYCNDELSKRVDSLTIVAQQQKLFIKQIPVKYETVRNNIRLLPVNDQLRLFSEFLSSIDSTEYRHTGTDNN